MSQTKREMPVPEPGQQWGILGGAFDPIHLGHLNLARQISKQCRLTGVVFVPAIRPPHRDNNSLSSFTYRLNMAELGVVGDDHFMVSAIESDHNLSGLTIDTLLALRAKYPAVSFDVIVGADQAAVFDTWQRPGDILALARLLVGARPGVALSIPDCFDRSRIEVCHIELVDLSSSEIRRRIRSGIAKCDLSEMVPAPVAEYIIEHELYQS